MEDLRKSEREVNEEKVYRQGTEKASDRIVGVKPVIATSSLSTNDF